MHNKTYLLPVLFFLVLSIPVQADEFDRKEIQLDDYYKTLKRISTKEQQMLLTKGQQAWMTYREDWCRVEEQSAEAPGGRSNYYICLLEKTEKQMEVINRFSFEKLH